MFDVIKLFSEVLNYFQKQRKQKVSSIFDSLVEVCGREVASTYVNKVNSLMCAVQLHCLWQIGGEKGVD